MKTFITAVLWVVFCSPLLVTATPLSESISTGDRYFSQMRYRDAVAWYQMDSSNADSQWRISRAYVCFADIVSDDACENYYRKAVTAAKRAIQLDYNNGNGHTWLAASLGNIAVFEGSRTKVKLCNEIKKELDLAIAINPNDDVALSILGSFYRILGNISWFERKLADTFLGGIPEGGFLDSEITFRRAINLSPYTMRHWFELGLLYKDWGKNQKAKETFDKAQLLTVQLASDRNRLIRISQYLDEYIGGEASALK